MKIEKCTGVFRYRFQGQEQDDEIKEIKGSSLNYKYRMRDPRLGRFLSLDPLAPDYPDSSPYAFSENIVTNSTELEGLEQIAPALAGYGSNYSQSDRSAFEKRALDMEKLAYSTAIVLTGEEFINELVRENSEAGYISRVIHFAHGGADGLYLKRGEGLYVD